MQDKVVINTIKDVLPSVVSIAITKSLEDVKKEMHRMVHGRGKDAEISSDLIDAHGMVSVGGGSGFVVSSDGLIITNKHVVFDTRAEYSVITSDNKAYPAMILTRDPIYDVAILKINASGLPIVKLGDASKLELGESVITIGNALGIFRNTVSLGIVSGLSRVIVAQADPKSKPQEMRGLIQTDAAINSGNSGGPLVNLDGEVVGINAAIVSGAQNINFAIPINAVKRDLDDLLRFGHIRRPLLGLRFVSVDENLQEKMKLKIGYGALVIKESPKDFAIVPKGPADKAGIKEGDIIFECNEKKITPENTLPDCIDQNRPGDIIRLKILRHDKEYFTKLTLEERR